MKMQFLPFRSIIPKHILNLVRDVDVVGIDEAQFFDNQLADTCDQLAVAEASGSSLRAWIWIMPAKPFGQIPFLLAKADYITKLHAICVRCGNIANYSYRKTQTR